MSNSQDDDPIHARPSGSLPGERARLRVKTDEEYAAIIERLANDVVGEALREGWLMYLPDDESQSPLQRSINELARNLRHVHFDGDGCLDYLDEQDEQGDVS